MPRAFALFTAQVRLVAALLATTLGLPGVRRGVPERLTEIHEASPPPQGELLLHSITQQCQGGAVSPWIGRVHLESIADTTWVR